jgi:hypothetical protein
VWSSRSTAELLAQEKQKDEYQPKDENAHPCLNFCLPNRGRKISSGPLGQDCQDFRTNQIAFDLPNRLMALGHGQAQACPPGGQHESPG